MKLFDKLAEKLALRWAKRKLEKSRKEGSGVVKILDGNKRLIVVLGFVASSFVAMLTGHDVSQWLDLLLRATGWTDPDLIGGAKEMATRIAPLLFAVWAAVSALWKMWQQHKAGATLTEINSPVGVVKAAVADGSLKVKNDDPSDPVVLKVEGKTIPHAPSVE